MSHHLSNPEVKPPTKVDSGLIDHEPWNGFIEEGITVKEIEGYIHEFDPPSINPPYELHEDGLQTCVPEKQKNIFDDPCYLSFGDKGTTATMTCWGQHVQISRYLGYGRSGIVCMDHKETEEPYLKSSRRLSLLGLIKYGAGFGCDIVLPGTGPYSHSVSWIRNRWPRVLFREKESWEIVQRSFIRNGVVIQEILLHNQSAQELEAKLTVDFDILTRQLEFQDSSNKFNEDIIEVERKIEGDKNEKGKSGVDADYTHGAGPAGYGFVQIHWTPSGKKQRDCGAQPDAVASVWGFFINGKAKKMEVFERENPFKVNPGQTFQFITGYKLVLLSTKSPSWKLLTISAADVDIEDFLHDSAPKEKKASKIDPDSSECKFSMSRIIEHILGVCAIPKTPDYVWEKGLSVKSESQSNRGKDDKQEMEPIALTQGEMAFHRVSTRESFFAFKLLLEAAKHLPDSDPLRGRIMAVCKGHLKWVFEVADREGTKFHRDYWANGKPIPNVRPSGNEVANTPLQLLKAYGYYIVFSSVEERATITKYLESFSAMDWVRALHKQNERKAYAWCHVRRDVNYFRLDDHILIVNALEAISQMMDWDTATVSRRNQRQGSDNQEPKDYDSLRQMYDPKRVSREVIKRFTMTSDSKQRIMAVTRSPRENRLQFHSKDTILFYNLVKRVLSLDIPAWKATVEEQKGNISNKFIDSDNPLYHGLCMLMGKEGVTDEGKSFRRAIQNLARRDSWVNYDGICFDISFEVPFLLHSHEVQSSTETNDFPDEKVLSIDIHDPPDRKFISNDHIDEKSVVDVREEWLYDRPAFFDWPPDENTLKDEWLLLKVNPDFFWDLKLLAPDQSGQDVDEVKRKKTGEFINRAIADWQAKAEEEEKDQYQPSSLEKNESASFLFLDVPKKKASGRESADNKRHEVRGTFRSEDAWDQLIKKRNEDEAKKRLLWFARAPSDHSIMCYLPSPEAEQIAISLFFDRHTKYLNYFEDKTNRVMNTWETEFHCNFLQLCEYDSRTDLQASCPMLTHLETDLQLTDKKVLVRASASFRIVGDFFDKFWTSLIVENFPVTQPEHLVYFLRNSRLLEQVLGNPAPRLWQQRKVLEPMLLFRILSEINRSIEKILNSIEDCIKKDKDNDPGQVTEKYFDSHTTWARLHGILDILKVDLDSIMANIKDWNSREKDRRDEKPRWTNQDERKYRHAITTIELLNQKALRGLLGHKAKVESLERSLTFHENNSKNKYDAKMSLRSFRQNQNIQYFTYSTVFFLPLGFATSIYSMSASPPSDVIWKMIACAVIAFIVLVIAVRLSPYMFQPERPLGAENQGKVQPSLSSVFPFFSTQIPENKSFEKRPDDNEESHDKLKQECSKGEDRNGGEDLSRHQRSSGVMGGLSMLRRKASEGPPHDLEKAGSASTKEEQPETQAH
ncbi:uncharacterized protein BDW47DRAFT_132853 [Aspergillus candidus]|uniref:Uncharacterized protein n=1 Tax=Aspergillus candidus TaxID=41067 RepID=A0A2I2F6X2_ASPCN|nr:hypothetical protein BDW47DRAFT_132853 [Aspergillus candidus]PLB36400.1 hypothetical protein BDW47DRAFT_132853 [Aspergillus candidus]